jgi:hypothetical protein
MFDLVLVGGAVAAVLFLTSANYVLDVYSAVNSSPWTAENVTAGDPEKEQSLLRYCLHAAGQTVVLIGITAILARSLWWVAVLGGGLELGYMSYLYWDAVKRGRRKTGMSFDGAWSGDKEVASSNKASDAATSAQFTAPIVTPTAQYRAAV